MYLCYVDESGTPETPGTSTHFVLAGISIPIWNWREADRDISQLLAGYGLAGHEFHTAWILRPYIEQSKISGFENLTWEQRRSAVLHERNKELLRLQASGNHKARKQSRKNFAHTEPYIHLTMDERKSLVQKAAECVSNWSFARLFAECIDKFHFDPARTNRSIADQAFEQLVSRFEQYLVNTDEAGCRPNLGLLVHDNNETVARKHTALMRRFHSEGTLWTRIDRLIETPLFVESSLTSMVQVADLCCYAFRRYLEKQEKNLFDPLFRRADRIQDRVVGIRHFTNLNCACEICSAHRKPGSPRG